MFQVELAQQKATINSDLMEKNEILDKLTAERGNKLTTAVSKDFEYLIVHSKTQRHFGCINLK